MNISTVYIPAKAFRLIALSFIVSFIGLPVYAQYEIKKNGDQYELWKKNKVQKKASVELLKGFNIEGQDKLVYKLTSKKEEGLAYEKSDGSGWVIEWFDRIALSADDPNLWLFGLNGFVPVVEKGKYGLYSCKFDAYFIAPELTNISIFDPMLLYLKLEKDGQTALMVTHFIYKSDFADKILFADEMEVIMEEPEYFKYKLNGQWNAYNINFNQRTKKHEYKFLLEDGCEGFGNWPIVKKNGKYGLLRYSDHLVFQADSQIYNNRFDTLYQFKDEAGKIKFHEYMIGEKEDGYFILRAAVKDEEGIYYNPFDVLYTPGYGDTLNNLKLRYHYDRYFGYWQVNEAAYDSIYVDQDALIVKRNGLYGTLKSNHLHAPSNQLIDLTFCKSQSPEVDKMIYDPEKLERREDIVSYQLFAADQGRNIFRVNYKAYSTFVEELYFDSIRTIISFTAIIEHPNNLYVIENDGFIKIIQYNPAWTYNGYVENLIRQMEERVFVRRDFPSEDYMKGYYAIKVALRDETIQIMMDAKGVEFKVSQSFLDQYKSRYDRMEYIGTQTPLSEYMSGYYD